MTEETARNNGPVVAIMSWPGLGMDQYDAVINALDYKNQEGEWGGIYHTATDDGGVSVVDVWSSPAALQTFVETRLGPTTTRLQISPPANQRIAPVHNLVIPPGALNAAPNGAVRVIFDIPGCTADQYDQVIRDLDAAGLTHPDGRIIHVAAPTDNGWMVMDVWESLAAFEAIAPTLMPFLARAGVPITAPPTVTPLHNTLHQPTKERNKAIAVRFYEAADRIGAGEDLRGEIDDYFAPGFEAHVSGVPTAQSAQDFYQFTRAFAGGFPGYRHSVEDQVAEGDRVVTRIKWHGTHRGEFNGMPPTGKHVDMDGITILRIHDGKIAEMWGQFDQVGMMQQLGVPRAPDVTEEEERNKAVVQQFLDNVLNNHDVSALAPLAGPGYLNYIAVRPEPFALDEVYGPLQMFFDAFPDMRHETKAVVAEGDTVAVQYTINATHSGAFQDIPPTSRPVTINGIALYRVRDGKIVEDYPGFSPLDLLQQLGVIPMPEAAPA